MMRIAVLSALVASLAACAHSGPSLDMAQRLEIYRAHAGPPVASFQINRVAGVTRWTPLGDQALAIWKGFSRDTRKNAPQNSNNSFGAMT